MEEENNIGLTLWDNLTTTTNGDYLIATGGAASYGTITTNTDNNNITITTDGNYLVAGGSLMYGSHTSWGAPYDMDFKLPDIFLKVIKLMIPEIKNVIVSNSSLNIDSLNRIGELTINLFIVLDETSSGDKNYEERIRDLFKLTLPNIDYVTLNVKQFDSNNKKFDEILKLFGK
jgi:hypothetical protein